MRINQDFEVISFKYILKETKYLDNISSDFFENKDLNTLLKIFKQYYRRFKESPSKAQFKVLINQLNQKGKNISPDLIEPIYNIDLREYDEDWLLRTFHSWVKWKNYEESIFDAIEYTKSHDVTPENVEQIVEHVTSLIQKKNAISFDDNLGSDFFEAEFHETNPADKVTSGYNFIDRLCYGGYDRKSLVCHIGPPNRGKSIFLANDAANAIKDGKNVVVISCEMAEQKFIKRIGSNLMNISIDDYDAKAKDRDFIKRKLQTVGNGLIVPGKLFIKQFPTSQATVIDVENYIKKLEELKDIKIDVVVLDYINILANYRNRNSEHTYMKIKQIAEDLRGMAVSNDWLIITASQTGKQAFDVTDFDLQDIAESAGLAHTCDFITGIIQDTQMQADGIYWLKLLKVRDGEGKGYKCKVKINYKYMRLSETDEILKANDHLT